MFNESFWKQVDEDVTNGFISVQKHPTFDLYIYNYSHETMFAGHWNDATLNCRGLVVDSKKNIIARPFPKFFTKEQAEALGMKIPNEPFEVFDKLDGSLGILFRYNDEFHFATRGSFVSDQAVEAMKILTEKYSDVFFSENHTYLFEIIYPENRIVVDYKGMRDIVLLGVIENATGREEDREFYPYGIPVVKRYHCEDFEKVMEQFEGRPGTEFEGLVVRFQSGFRVKLKTEDYKTLHKIMTGLSEKDIWECLSSGIGLDEIIKVAPDEMYPWIEHVAEKLREEYQYFVEMGISLHAEAMQYAGNQIDFSRDEKLHKKKFAEIVLKNTDGVVRSVAFQMYSKSDYAPLIWKAIKPVGGKRFRILAEAE